MTKTTTKSITITIQDDYGIDRNAEDFDWTKTSKGFSGVAESSPNGGYELSLNATGSDLAEALIVLGEAYTALRETL